MVIYFLSVINITIQAAVAKWQTHLTQNQASNPHAGSSPASGIDSQVIQELDT